MNCHPMQTVSDVVSINVILAAIGFVVGVTLGMAAFTLVVGERYRVWAARHPWIRLVSILWFVGCGATAAFLASRLAG
jgi:hypothetical protein